MENQDQNFDYPEFDFTISQSDLLPPVRAIINDN